MDHMNVSEALHKTNYTYNQELEVVHKLSNHG